MPKPDNWRTRKAVRDANYQHEASRKRWELGDRDFTPKDPVRRESTKYDYPLFCKTYFPAINYLPWSPNHYMAAERISSAVLTGGWFAFAMPRGSGKTSMSEEAALWAICHSHSPYVVLIGATEPSSEARLKSLKIELSTNELLAEDFPEICIPIIELGTSWRSAEYQTHMNNRTAILLSTKKLVLPTIYDRNNDYEQFPTSGSIIQVAGITGEIRGLNHKKQDGSIARPTLAIADDCQTRESARSPSQSDTRSKTIASDVAYLNGPDSSISVLFPCTVIYPDDMADRLLNRELHYEFHGVRTKMVDKFPDDMSLWDKYSEILKDSLRNDGDMEPATAFYRENREAMDAGFEVSWPERYAEPAISAIQHAMNLKIRDEDAFWSECQNEPRMGAGDTDIMCSPSDVLSKMTHHVRRVVPKEATVLTAMIDPKMTCLHWMVVAWAPGFDGWIVDYGPWPLQGNIRIFGAKSLRRRFDDEYPHKQPKEQVYRALSDLVDLLDRQYNVEGGGEMRLDRILIDANMGQITGTVYQFCREASHGVKLTPSHGVYVGATSVPWSDLKRRKGERVGPHWRDRRSEEWPIRHVNIDVNFWKTTVHQLLKADFGAEGSISLYGFRENNQKLDERHHTELADQICSEYVLRVEAKQRTVYEWKERPNQPDNEGLDLLVGCAVGASMQQIELPGHRNPSRRKPREVIDLGQVYSSEFANKGIG